MTNKRITLTVISLLALFTAVLFFSACLSKDSDDETIYAALAAKIQSRGFHAYNLHEISITSAGGFWKLSYEETGNLLGLLAQSGVTYYDTAFYFNPPLFSSVLVLSHQIFNQPLNFLLLKRDQAIQFHFEQFYAVFPNAIFFIIFLLSVFFLGQRYFDTNTGFLAAFFCLTSPVILIVTFKVWSDLMAAMLVLLSFLCWKGKERSIFKTALSGVLFGLAILTRISAIFAIFIFLTREWKSFLLWLAMVLLITSGWFYAIFRNYGTFFYFPEVAGAKETLVWLKSISHPWYFYIADIIYLSPVFLVAVFSIREKTQVFLLWIVSFIVPLSILLYTQKPLGLEDRYLLPCYPPLAVLAARTTIDIQKRVPRWIVCIAILLASVWSLKVAGYLVLSRESLNFVSW